MPDGMAGGVVLSFCYYFVDDHSSAHTTHTHILSVSVAVSVSVALSLSLSLAISFLLLTQQCKAAGKSFPGASNYVKQRFDA